MQGKLNFETFTFAREMPCIFEELCSYTLTKGSTSYRYQDLSSAIPSPSPFNRQTARFQLLEPGRVHLRGFRCYLTEDNRFLLDESLDPGWSLVDYSNRFSSTGYFEDYTATFTNQEVKVPVLVSDITIENEIISLCSAEPSNYGSWIYRIIPKLISLQQDTRPILLYAGSTWQSEFLNYFVPGRDIIRHNPKLIYSLKNAQIATMRNRGVQFDDKTREYYRQTSEAVPGCSNLKYIYLSRSTQKLRQMYNEDILEKALVRRGFSIIRIEALSLLDRIRVIRDAEIIVCPGGSGLFNLVFALSAHFVLDIEPGTTWLSAHSHLMNSLELPHSILIGKQIESADPHAGWASPIDDILVCVDQYI